MTVTHFNELINSCNVDVARKVVIQNANRMRLQNAMIMWTQKALNDFELASWKSSFKMVKFEDGFFYVDVEFFDFVMVKWEIVPQEILINYNGTPYISFTGQAKLSNIVTDKTIFEGKISISTISKKGPHFCEGKVYTDNGILFAEGYIGGSSRRFLDYCNVYYHLDGKTILNDAVAKVFYDFQGNPVDRYTWLSEQDQNVCMYKFTRRREVCSNYRFCDSCGTSVCHACAVTCHKNHRVLFMKKPVQYLSYCRCGAGECMLSNGKSVMCKCMI
jgi:hypothetical protein